MIGKLIAAILAAAALWSIALTANGGDDESAANVSKAFATAYDKQKAIAIFVNAEQRKLPNTVSVQVWEYGGDDTARILVAKPGDVSLTRLPSTATDAEIQAAISPLVVSQPARFFTPNSSKAGTADVEYARSVWPFSVVMPDNLEVYRPARLVQHTGNRSGNGSHSVESRTVLEEKWLVPGGLVGVHGWRSILLRSVDNEYQSKRVRANPSEQLGEIVYAKIYGRATFYDLLLNDQGKPFELRQAVKSDGQWDRFVAWKDRSARPRGYHPFTTNKACVDCHSEAGDGGYGSARKPGWDTVLSEALDGVEANGPVVDAFDYQPFGGSGGGVFRGRGRR